MPSAVALLRLVAAALLRGTPPGIPIGAMLRGCFLPILAVSLALTAVASAAVASSEGSQPAGVRLSWVRAADAAGCITPPALEHQVAERLGWDPFQGGARQWIEGIVTREGGKYRVELFERDAEGGTVGSRTLHAPADDCRNLDEAVSLAIALIIDPTAMLLPSKEESASRTRSGQDGPAPSVAHPVDADRDPRDNENSAAPLVSVSTLELKPRTDVPARLRAVPPVTAPRCEERDPPLSAAVMATPIAVAGVFPRTAFGVETASEVSWSRSGAALWLGMVYLPEQWVEHGDGELGYGLTALDLGLCLATRGERVRGFGCATLEVGALHTVVRQPDPLDPGDRFWLAGRAHAGVEVALLDPIWLEARLFAAVPHKHWAFRVRVDGVPRQVHEQWWVMPGLGIGVGLHFE